jgi:hypothetical protein
MKLFSFVTETSVCLKYIFLVSLMLFVHVAEATPQWNTLWRPAVRVGASPQWNSTLLHFH